MQKSLNAFKAKTRECLTIYKTGDYEQTISICSNVIKELYTIKSVKEHKVLLSIVLEIRAKCYQSMNRPDKYLEDYTKLAQINPSHKEVEKFFVNANRILTKNYRDSLELVGKKDEEIAKLPNKTNITDIENVKFDQFRLDFIKTCLRFLAEDLKKELDLVSNNPDLTVFDKYYLNLLLLTQGIGWIKAVGHCIVNLSGQLRGEYKEFLNSYAINWITLEHIARVIDDGHNKIMGIPTYPEDNSEQQILNLFFQEYQSVHLIAEAALKDILKDDIEKLITIFDYISNSNKEDPFPKLEKVLAIKTLSRLILDVSTIANLLRLAVGMEPIDDHNLGENVPFDKMTGTDVIPLSVLIPNSVVGNLSENINKKLYQHAFLRKLQKIGEFITNKNLSKSTKELNPTIDWQIFIDIRDSITHQDEKSYKYNLNNLLSSNLNVLGYAMQEINYTFFLRLQDLIFARYKNLPIKLNENLDNIESFWQALYQQELESDSMTVTVKYRVSQEAYNRFVSVFAEINMSEDLKQKWQDFLVGNSDRPNQKDWGNMLQSISNYKDLKKIAKEAYKPAKPARDIRIATEQKLAEERKIQEEEQKNKINYKGLEYTKQLRDLLMQNIEEKQIDSSGMLQSAIDALNNIKEFLEQDKFINMNFNYPDEKTWSDAYSKDKDAIYHFYARMLTSPELRNAIEYNAGQLLQNLDKLREEENCSKLLNEKFYEPLRLLRNHIEHGNHIYDAQRYQPGKEPEVPDEKSKIIGPIMMKLIFDLLPQLETVSGNHSSITEFASYDNLAPQLDIEAKIEHVDLVGSPSTKGFDDGEEYC